jgi:hypothetical protein
MRAGIVVRGAWRTGAGLVVAGAIAFLGGCSQGCAAIDLYNVVTVDLAGGAAQRVAFVELCVDDVCGASAGESAAETPGAGRPQVIGGDDVRTVWSVDLPVESRAAATATAFGADGTVLGTTSESLSWDPRKSNRACEGGPVEGGPMTITIP